MNILFITDLYPVKDTETTTPKTLLNFVKEWEKQRHTVKVIKPNFILNSFLRCKPFYKTGQYENVYNVNYWTPFLGNVKNKINNLSDFQLVIAHMPSGILFADKLGLPFVAGIHNSDLTVLTSPLYAFHFRKRMIKALKNAKAIACRSFVIKNKLLKLFPEFENKTFVAPSGIDISGEQRSGGQEVKPLTVESEKWKVESLLSPAPSLDGEVWDGVIFAENSEIEQKSLTDTDLFAYSPIRLYTDINHSTLKILTCAHLKKRKNIDKLILACKDLEGVELTVIGDGKIRKSLEKLDKKVIFTGELEQEQVYEKMRESDVFILPSVEETFGMVYLEAMASGCITVCTKNDGIDGIIKDGENGFLTEPNVENIKDTILKIKTLPPEIIETIKQNTLETVKEYTSSKVAENYLQQILKIF